MVMTMKKYKIIYWLANQIKVTFVEAKDKQEALTIFYLHNICDDVTAIAEVKA